MTLTELVIALQCALAGANVPHAFGGALALAWCTQRARGTIDIDVNVFLAVEQADLAFAALPSGIDVSEQARAAVRTAGQARLWWDGTPVDVFYNTSPLHADAATRAHIEHFAGHDVPFLACRDLAVFKAYFDRTRDWADLEEMIAAGTLDVEAVLGVLAWYLVGDASGWPACARSPWGKRRRRRPGPVFDAPHLPLLGQRSVPSGGRCRQEPDTLVQGGGSVRLVGHLHPLGASRDKAIDSESATVRRSVVSTARSSAGS